MIYFLRYIITQYRLFPCMLALFIQVISTIVLFTIEAMITAVILRRLMRHHIQFIGRIVAILMFFTDVQLFPCRLLPGFVHLISTLLLIIWLIRCLLVGLRNIHQISF